MICGRSAAGIYRHLKQTLDLDEFVLWFAISGLQAWSEPVRKDFWPLPILHSSALCVIAVFAFDLKNGPRLCFRSGPGIFGSPTSTGSRPSSSWEYGFCRVESQRKIVIPRELRNVSSFPPLITNSAKYFKYVQETRSHWSPNSWLASRPLWISFGSLSKFKILEHNRCSPARTVPRFLKVSKTNRELKSSDPRYSALL